jgi:hypothetical protein
VQGVEYDFLFVFICPFSGKVELISARKTFTATDCDNTCFRYVFAHQGTIQVLISDRSRRFVAQFRQVMHAAADTTLSMSSGHHSRSNANTEHMNRTINSLMRQLVNEWQTDWASQIPYAQFAEGSAASQVLRVSDAIISERTRQAYSANAKRRKFTILLNARCSMSGSGSPRRTYRYCHSESGSGHLDT